MIYQPGLWAQKASCSRMGWFAERLFWRDVSTFNEGTIHTKISRYTSWLHPAVPAMKVGRTLAKGGERIRNMPKTKREILLPYVSYGQLRLDRLSKRCLSLPKYVSLDHGTLAKFCITITTSYGRRAAGVGRPETIF